VRTQRRLRLATRGSRLALAQAESVAALLRERWPGLTVDLISVATLGDRRTDVPLAELPGPDGVFTRGIEAELLAGSADLAVHSLKDLPTAIEPALVLAAFPPRADPRDVLVSRQGGGLTSLRAASLIGTSSPRRAAQVLAARPELRIAPIRGNVDTRLRKLRAGEVEALVLGAAGLERLGLLREVSEFLPVDRFTPAVGQGALVTQCRAVDEATCSLVSAIDDTATRAAVIAERAFLRRAGGGCRAPLAAFGELSDGRLVLRGFLATTDGAQTYTGTLEGPLDEPEVLGVALADELLARQTAAG
jgi:hydroxymethylbilane synthase